MKIFFLSLVAFLFASVSYAQNSEVEVYEKKEGDKTLIMARNIGKSEYKVKVTIKSEGMDVSPSSVVEVSLPAGFMKEMARVTPRPGELWSYSYDVAISRTVSKTTTTPASTPDAPKQTTTATTTTTPKTVKASPILSDAAIILYAKPGCGRCTFAKKHLNNLGIAYEEVDTQSDSPEVPNMWTQLRNQGFKGGSVTMPVIRVNGQYHYDIKDLEGFIGKLKS